MRLTRELSMSFKSECTQLILVAAWWLTGRFVAAARCAFLSITAQ
jgi:hypothetical protein